MDGVDTALVAVVTLLVQVAKGIPAVHRRRWLWPLLGVGLGIAAIYVRAGLPADPTLAWQGVLTGLASLGLYSGIKSELEHLGDSGAESR